jgi:hypothetical protein
MTNADPQQRFRRYLKKSYSASISESSNKNQQKLYSYITEHRLSDLIELFEEFGYSSEIAIFKIRYFQLEGVAR